MPIKDDITLQDFDPELLDMLIEYLSKIIQVPDVNPFSLHEEKTRLRLAYDSGRRSVLENIINARRNHDEGE